MDTDNRGAACGIVKAIEEASTIDGLRVVLKVVETMSHFHLHEAEAIKAALMAKLKELNEQSAELCEEIRRVLNEDKVVP